MDPAAPTTTVLATPSERDPLADAYCQKCGYSLRGLPENRCPECGAPFDPAEFSASFLPEWPRLLTWFMAAWILLAVLGAADSVFHAIGQGPPGDIEVNLLGLRYLNNAPLMILVGIPAIIGLHRRVDLGRRLAVALLLLLALLWTLILIASAVSVTTFGPEAQAALLAESASRLLGSVLPCMILAVALLTGLRRRSLRRSGQVPVLRLPLSRFRPRHDWPLLLAVLLGVYAFSGLGRAAHLGGSYLLLTAMDPWDIPLGEDETWCLCNLIADSLVGFAFAAGAIIIWKKPRRAVGTLRTLLGLSLGMGLALMVIYFAVFGMWVFMGGTWSEILSPWVSAISNLVIPLVLYLYISFALPQEAIERVADPDSHPQCQVMPSGKGARRRNGAV